MGYLQYCMSKKWIIFIAINLSILLDILTTVIITNSRGFEHELNPFFDDTFSFIIANLLIMAASSLIFLWVYPDDGRTYRIREMSYKKLIGINLKSSISNLFHDEETKSVVVYTVLVVLLTNSFVKLFATLNNLTVILTGYGFSYMFYAIGSLFSVELNQSSLYFTLFIFSFILGFLLSFFGTKKYL